MAPIPGQGTKIPLASEQLSICANYWAFALRACATTRVHVPREKIPGAATKSQCSQTNKHFSKRKENGAYPIPTQCDFHMYYFQPLHLSIPDNFSSSPYLWLYCSLFPESTFFICVFQSYTVPTSNARSSKILPWFPRWNHLFSLQAVITHYLTQCLFVHDPKFFLMYWNKHGLCIHISLLLPAPNPPLPSQPFNSSHQSGCRISDTLLCPSSAWDLSETDSTMRVGCLERKPL